MSEATGVTFDVLYYQKRYDGDKEFSHKYSEGWSKTNLFCPQCGKREVWANDGPGDYYVDNQYLCLAPTCAATFYLPGGVMEASGEQDDQRLREIASAKQQATQR